MPESIINLFEPSSLNAPAYVLDALHYEAVTGSRVYGVAEPDSDVDVVGFCIPPKAVVFPYFQGEIPGFDRHMHHFEQWQGHHIEHGGLEYDITVYSIVRYFRLLVDGNPNILDSLFVPERCLLHRTRIGQMVRDSRKLFLSRQMYSRFAGYAYSQMDRMVRSVEGKRKESIDKYGYDVKAAYHTVRLLYEVIGILEDGELTLDAHAETLRAIRRGEWTLGEVQRFAGDRQKYLNKLYEHSTLLDKPDEKKIKALLEKCLEMAYGEPVFPRIALT